MPPPLWLRSRNPPRRLGDLSPAPAPRGGCPRERFAFGSGGIANAVVRAAAAAALRPAEERFITTPDLLDAAAVEKAKDRTALDSLAEMSYI